MKNAFFAIAALFCLALTVMAEDSRRQPPKDLNGYFPFHPPATLTEWKARKADVRRQILVAQGLWPMPTKTPLNAVIHGKIEGGDYTVEKVYFESAPGFFVTGNLYRPKNIKGKVPGVLFAHGHWQDARLSLETPEKVRAEIAAGAEQFENGGRSVFQSLCVQVARMGCIVWQWDTLSDSDSKQFSRELVHQFAKQRPEMNTAQNWGLYSPQAEAHAQSVMGLQTWNAIRGLDFLLGLPEVDAERIAITGASGGGTQTMLLAAIDERIKLSFPCVMVSTSMQGGCTCENASLLRVDTGNVEFAALFAPRPQGMTTADDWTKEMSIKGFPDLQKLYALYGAEDNIFLHRGEQFPHNYNAVSRSAFYTFLNKHFKLGLPSPVVERDYQPLSRQQLSVWDEQHPAPKAVNKTNDADFERQLLKWFSDDAQKQLRAAATTKEGLQNVLRPAWEATIGRTFQNAGEVQWSEKNRQARGDYAQIGGTIFNKTYNEEIGITLLVPKQWNNRITIWLDDNGQAALQNDNVKKLLQNGIAVVGANLLFQGEDAMQQNRMVNNPREFAGYTFGYNNALFAQRTHDILSIVSFLRSPKTGPLPEAKSISLVAWHNSGPLALAARALAGEAINRAAVDTEGFRFGNLLDYRDARFLPAAAKYLDIPGLIALNAPHALWLAGEGNAPEFFGAKFDELTPFSGENKQAAAVEWLLKN